MTQRIMSTPKKLPINDMALFYRTNSNRDKPSLYSRMQATPDPPKREVMLIINVDIGMGEGTKIEVRRGDIPRRLAEDFCQKYGLDRGLVGVLEKQVMSEIEGIGEKCGQLKTDEDLERSGNREGKALRTEEDRRRFAEHREEEVVLQERPKEKPEDKLFINQTYSDSKGKRLEYWDRFMMSEKKAKPEENINKNLTFSPEINAISQEIMKCKKKAPVYNRLYFEAKVKANNRKNEANEAENAEKFESTSKNPMNRSKSAKQVGDQMYQKAMIRMERMKETEKVRKQKDEESLLKECSYHPKVNPISQMIVDYRRAERPGQRVENSLLNFVDSRNENLSKAKRVRIEEEMKECTFRPKVNEFRSEGKQRGKNIYNDLYNGYKTIEHKKERLKAKESETLTFQPKINENTNKLAQDFDFYQRLQIFEQMKRQKLQNNLEKVTSNIDPTTGQPFFQPRVNMNPSRPDPKTRKIWEFLYNERFRRQLFVEESIAKERAENNFGIPKLSAKSYELFEEKKLNLVIQMFGFFDSDNDGVISVDKINLENAPKEFLRVLIPISLKIAEKSEGMGVEEFYREFCEVYRGLNCYEKGELYKRSEELGGRSVIRGEEGEEVEGNNGHLA